MKENYLDEKLIEYGNSDAYPFHMPGHKRRSLSFPNPYETDITEIYGFDNLHHPTGVLKEAQDRGKALYGSLDCHFLINGSSCGLLAGIFAMTKQQGEILIARNCHKAVYHGILLRQLTAHYLYPKETGYGIQGGIEPEDVREALKAHPSCKAVVITSPTYDGVVSDIKSIARITREAGAVLFVDQAHGAHFGLWEGFPENAGKLGADLVVMSLHKTLPSFTQTAVLHRYSEQISEDQIRKYLGIFETSSPSYLLMMSMDNCIRYVKDRGEKAFTQYLGMLDGFRQDTKGLRNLKVLGKNDFSTEEAYDFDQGKLLIITKGKGYSGADLAMELRENYHLEMEMTAGNYVVAMTSIMDRQEGFDRLARALKEIDTRLEPTNSNLWEDRSWNPYKVQNTKLSIWEAEALPKEEREFKDAIGKISASYVYLYPPGIPILVPGEEVTADTIKALEQCLVRGLEIEGIPRSGCIDIVKQ